MIARFLSAAAMLATSTPALAGISFSLAQQTPAGLPAGFDYYTFDMIGTTIFIIDDWTSTSYDLTIAASEPDLTFNPRLPLLNPGPNPNVPGGEPPRTPDQTWGNMFSTPNDFPNTLEPGSPFSTRGTAGPLTAADTRLMHVVFDTTTNVDVSFVLARITIRSAAGSPGLTLTNTGRVAATGITASTIISSGRLWPFNFTIYRLPEPGTLALFGLAGLAGLARRH